MKRMVVLGGGESGTGAAILAKAKGYEVMLSDMGSISQKYKDMLDAEGIAWEEGHHTESLILNADEVVKSPGIPPTAPIVRALTDKGVPVISEIELAGRYTNAKMVCITGSNGKTTTTLLTHHILTNAGIDAALAGNVGQSMALQAARGQHEVYVIELSSFQLENIYDFRADIAVIMNITPDHLDRYDHKMQNYIDAKFRILQNMRPRDSFIYWYGDPIVRKEIERREIAAAQYPFAENKVAGAAAYVDAAGKLEIHTPATSLEMPRAELSLPGVHNLYDSMAAATAAALLGVDANIIRRSLSDFKPVEHRLEPVATVGGVRYVNDSKATNVDSTFYALGSMTTPTVLILGGKDKGNDYSQILPLVREKVKAIVAMGKDNAKILDFFKDEVAVIADTHSLDDAIEACRRLACDGDTVLLSPCCASFDLFKSYEDRGERFKQAVKKLI